MIALVPDLHDIVQQRVRGLAIVSSQGPDYDTSHSEPAWPGWIFVSIPGRGVRGALRLAEGVIHEAMHHNLTALEHQLPLTLSDDAIYSPWKQETRTASGVLHGLYVFVCLAAYFHQICRQACVGDASRARIAAILEEVASIDRARLEAALSESGLRFCQALYDSAMFLRSNHG
ncbi:aKG-HExxH-type peptide beta-hydroxylase [Sphingobium tyrosinilyticum]|uniref:HEXXH motif-containing putative peptide modification protein n=1 Tax=Sphingobium tyrosinilyticum TaxID=2715436 RepID=A0ABV9F1D2_9SPHN